MEPPKKQLVVNEVDIFSNVSVQALHKKTHALATPTRFLDTKPLHHQSPGQPQQQLQQVSSDQQQQQPHGITASMIRDFQGRLHSPFKTQRTTRDLFNAYPISPTECFSAWRFLCNWVRTQLAMDAPAAIPGFGVLFVKHDSREVRILLFEAEQSFLDRYSLQYAETTVSKPPDLSQFPPNMQFSFYEMAGCCGNIEVAKAKAWLETIVHKIGEAMRESAKVELNLGVGVGVIQCAFRFIEHALALRPTHKSVIPPEYEIRGSESVIKRHLAALTTKPRVSDKRFSLINDSLPAAFQLPSISMDPTAKHQAEMKHRELFSLLPNSPSHAHLNMGRSAPVGGYHVNSPNVQHRQAKRTGNAAEDANSKNVSPSKLRKEKLKQQLQHGPDASIENAWSATGTTTEQSTADGQQQTVQVFPTDESIDDQVQDEFFAVLFDDHSRTFCVEVDRNMADISPSNRIGSNYTLSAANIMLVKHGAHGTGSSSGTHGIGFLEMKQPHGRETVHHYRSDPRSFQGDHTVQHNTDPLVSHATSSQSARSRSVVVSRHMRNSSIHMTTADSERRYFIYIRDHILEKDLFRMNDRQVDRVVALSLPRNVQKNQQQIVPIQHVLEASIEEFINSFYRSLKKAILDYLLLRQDTCTRLVIPFGTPLYALLPQKWRWRNDLIDADLQLLARKSYEHHQAQQKLLLQQQQQQQQNDQQEEKAIAADKSKTAKDTQWQETKSTVTTTSKTSKHDKSGVAKSVAMASQLQETNNASVKKTKARIRSLLMLQDVLILCLQNLWKDIEGILLVDLPNVEELCNLLEPWDVEAFEQYQLQHAKNMKQVVLTKWYHRAKDLIEPYARVFQLKQEIGREKQAQQQQKEREAFTHAGIAALQSAKAGHGSAESSILAQHQQELDRLLQTATLSTMMEHDCKRFFDCIATLMSRQIRAIVMNSIRAYLEFFEIFASDKLVSISDDGSTVAKEPKSFAGLTVVLMLDKDDGTIQFKTPLEDIPMRLLSVLQNMTQVFYNLDRIEAKFDRPLQWNHPNGRAYSPFLWNVSLQEDELQSITKRIRSILHSNMDSLKSLQQHYQSLVMYRHATFDASSGFPMEKLNDLTFCREELERVRYSSQMIFDKTCDRELLNLFQVDCQHLNRNLLVVLSEWTHGFFKSFSDLTSRMNSETRLQYKEIATKLAKRPVDLYELVEAESFVEALKNHKLRLLHDKVSDLKHRIQFMLYECECCYFSCVNTKTSLPGGPLPTHDRRPSNSIRRSSSIVTSGCMASNLAQLINCITPELLGAIAKTVKWRSHIEKLLRDAEGSLVNERSRIESIFLAKRTRFYVELEEFNLEVKSFAKKGDLRHAATYVVQLSKMKEALAALRQSIESITEEEIKLKWKPSDFSKLDEIALELEPYDQLWRTTRDFREFSSRWLRTNLFDLNAQDGMDVLYQMLGTISNVSKILQTNCAAASQTAELVKKQLMDFRENVKMVVAILNPFMKDRHLQEISQLVNVVLDVREPLTLLKLLESGALVHLPKILEISEIATIEKQIESVLEDVTLEWDEVVFRFRNMKHGGVLLVPSMRSHGNAGNDVVMIGGAHGLSRKASNMALVPSSGSGNSPNRSLKRSSTNRSSSSQRFSVSSRLLVNAPTGTAIVSPNASSSNLTASPSVEPPNDTIDELDGLTLETASQFVVSRESVEEILLLIDDHRVRLQSLLCMPHSGPFLMQITHWQRFLDTIFELTDLLTFNEKLWGMLYPFFENSNKATNDKNLQEAFKSFEQAAELYHRSIYAVLLKPFCLSLGKNALASQKLIEELQQCRGFLEESKENVRLSLETKRSMFSRFFFLDDMELMALLSCNESNEKHLEVLGKYLTRCFPGVARIQLNKEKEVIGIVSNLGEHLPIGNAIPSTSARNAMSVWMPKVESAILTVLQACMRASVSDMARKEFRKWCLLWPEQVILCTLQHSWTLRLENALKSLSLTTSTNQIQDILSDLKDKMVEVSLELKAATLPHAKSCLSNVMLKLSHLRETTVRVLDDKNTANGSFWWQLVPKFYWEDNAFSVRMLYSSFLYGFEYLGNYQQILLTPLSLRCMQTLFQHASSLAKGSCIIGDAPYTGKTTVLTELSRLCGRLLILFVCGSTTATMPNLVAGNSMREMMIKTIKGVASTGGWLCFKRMELTHHDELAICLTLCSKVIELVGARQSQWVYGGAGNTAAGSTNAIKLRRGVNFLCTTTVRDVSFWQTEAATSQLLERLSRVFQPVVFLPQQDLLLLTEFFLDRVRFSKPKDFARFIYTTLVGCEKMMLQSRQDFGLSDPLHGCSVTHVALGGGVQQAKVALVNVKTIKQVIARALKLHQIKDTVVVATTSSAISARENEKHEYLSVWRALKEQLGGVLQLDQLRITDFAKKDFALVFITDHARAGAISLTSIVMNLPMVQRSSSLATQGNASAAGGGIPSLAAVIAAVGSSQRSLAEGTSAQVLPRPQLIEEQIVQYASQTEPFCTAMDLIGTSAAHKIQILFFAVQKRQPALIYGDIQSGKTLLYTTLAEVLQQLHEQRRRSELSGISELSATGTTATTSTSTGFGVTPSRHECVAKTKCVVISPGALTLELFFGFPLEKDPPSVLMNIIREAKLAHESEQANTWLVLDGNLENCWLDELLLAVTDCQETISGNANELHLPSGKGLVLPTYMNILVETTWVGNASPSLLHKMVMVHLGNHYQYVAASQEATKVSEDEATAKEETCDISGLEDLSTVSMKTNWPKWFAFWKLQKSGVFEQLEAEVFDILVETFDFLMDDSLEFVRNHFRSQMVSCFWFASSRFWSCLALFESLLRNCWTKLLTMTTVKQRKTAIQCFLMQSIVWGIGSSFDVLEREKFDLFLKDKILKRDARRADQIGLTRVLTGFFMSESQTAVPTAASTTTSTTTNVITTSGGNAGTSGGTNATPSGGSTAPLTPMPTPPGTKCGDLIYSFAISIDFGLKAFKWNEFFENALISRWNLNENANPMTSIAIAANLVSVITSSPQPIGGAFGGISGLGGAAGRINDISSAAGVESFSNRRFSHQTRHASVSAQASFANGRNGMTGMDDEEGQHAFLRLLVPTLNLTSSVCLLDLLMKNQFASLLVGPSESGKTVCANTWLRLLRSSRAASKSNSRVKDSAINSSSSSTSVYVGSHTTSQEVFAQVQTLVTQRATNRPTNRANAWSTSSKVSTPATPASTSHSSVPATPDVVSKPTVDGSTTSSPPGTADTTSSLSPKTPVSSSSDSSMRRSPHFVFFDDLNLLTTAQDTPTGSNSNTEQPRKENSAMNFLRHLLSTQQIVHFQNHRIVDASNLLPFGCFQTRNGISRALASNGSSCATVGSNTNPPGSAPAGSAAGVAGPTRFATKSKFVCSDGMHPLQAHNQDLLRLMNRLVPICFLAHSDTELTSIFTQYAHSILFANVLSAIGAYRGLGIGVTLGHAVPNTAAMGAAAAAVAAAGLNHGGSHELAYQLMNMVIRSSIQLVRSLNEQFAWMRAQHLWKCSYVFHFSHIFQILRTICDFQASISSSNTASTTGTTAGTGASGAGIPSNSSFSRHPNGQNTVNRTPTSSFRRNSITDKHNSSSNSLNSPSSLSGSSAPGIVDKFIIVRLWCHESIRVFCDRFIEEADIEVFLQLLQDIVSANFASQFESFFPVASVDTAVASMPPSTPTSSGTTSVSGITPATPIVPLAATKKTHPPVQQPQQQQQQQQQPQQQQQASPTPTPSTATPQRVFAWLRQNLRFCFLHENGLTEGYREINDMARVESIVDRKCTDMVRCQELSTESASTGGTALPTVPNSRPTTLSGTSTRDIHGGGASSHAPFLRNRISSFRQQTITRSSRQLLQQANQFWPRMELISCRFVADQVLRLCRILAMPISTSHSRQVHLQGAKTKPILQHAILLGPFGTKKLTIATIAAFVAKKKSYYFDIPSGKCLAKHQKSFQSVLQQVFLQSFSFSGSNEATSTAYRSRTQEDQEHEEARDNHFVNKESQSRTGSFTGTTSGTSSSSIISTAMAAAAATAMGGGAGASAVAGQSLNAMSGGGSAMDNLERGNRSPPNRKALVEEPNTGVVLFVKSENLSADHDWYFELLDQFFFNNMNFSPFHESTLNFDSLSTEMVNLLHQQARQERKQLHSKQEVMDYFLKHHVRKKCQVVIILTTPLVPPPCETSSTSSSAYSAASATGSSSSAPGGLTSGISSGSVPGTSTNQSGAPCPTPLGSASLQHQLVISALFEKFPNLLKKCTLDYFQDWPEESLVTIAQRCLKPFTNTFEKNLANDQVSLQLFIRNVINMFLASKRFIEQQQIHDTHGPNGLTGTQREQLRLLIHPTCLLNQIVLFMLHFDKLRQRFILERDRYCSSLEFLQKTEQIIKQENAKLAFLQPEIQKTAETSRKTSVDLEKEKLMSSKLTKTLEVAMGLYEVKKKHVADLEKEYLQLVEDTTRSFDHAKRTLSAQAHESRILEFCSIKPVPSSLKQLTECIGVIFDVAPVMRPDEYDSEEIIADYWESITTLMKGASLNPSSRSPSSLPSKPSTPNAEASARPSSGSTLTLWDRMKSFELSAIDEKKLARLLPIVSAAGFDEDFFRRIHPLAGNLCEWVSRSVLAARDLVLAIPKKLQVQKQQQELQNEWSELQHKMQQIDVQHTSQSEVSKIHDLLNFQHEDLKEKLKENFTLLQMANSVVKVVTQPSSTWNTIQQQLPQLEQLQQLASNDTNEEASVNGKDRKNGSSNVSLSMRNWMFLQVFFVKSLSQLVGNLFLASGFLVYGSGLPSHLRRQLVQAWREDFLINNPLGSGFDPENFLHETFLWQPFLCHELEKSRPLRGTAENSSSTGTATSPTGQRPVISHRTSFINRPHALTAVDEESPPTASDEQQTAPGLSPQDAYQSAFGFEEEANMAMMQFSFRFPLLFDPFHMATDWIAQQSHRFVSTNSASAEVCPHSGQSADTDSGGSTRPSSSSSRKDSKPNFSRMSTRHRISNASTVSSVVDTSPTTSSSSSSVGVGASGCSCCSFVQSEDPHLLRLIESALVSKTPLVVLNFNEKAALRLQDLVRSKTRFLFELCRRESLNILPSMTAGTTTFRGSMRNIMAATTMARTTNLHNNPLSATFELDKNKQLEYDVLASKIYFVVADWGGNASSSQSASTHSMMLDESTPLFPKWLEKFVAHFTILAIEQPDWQLWRRRFCKEVVAMQPNSRESTFLLQNQMLVKEQMACLDQMESLENELLDILSYEKPEAVLGDVTKVVKIFTNRNGFGNLYTTYQNNASKLHQMDLRIDTRYKLLVQLGMDALRSFFEMASCLAEDPTAISQDCGNSPKTCYSTAGLYVFPVDWLFNVLQKAMRTLHIQWKHDQEGHTTAAIPDKSDSQQLDPTVQDQQQSQQSEQPSQTVATTSKRTSQVLSSPTLPMSPQPPVQPLQEQRSEQHHDDQLRFVASGFLDFVRNLGKTRFFEKHCMLFEFLLAKRIHTYSRVLKSSVSAAPTTTPTIPVTPIAGQPISSGRSSSLRSMGSISSMINTPSILQNKQPTESQLNEFWTLFAMFMLLNEENAFSSQTLIPFRLLAQQLSHKTTAVLTNNRQLLSLTSLSSTSSTSAGGTPTFSTTMLSSSLSKASVASSTTKLIALRPTCIPLKKWHELCQLTSLYPDLEIAVLQLLEENFKQKTRDVWKDLMETENPIAWRLPSANSPVDEVVLLVFVGIFHRRFFAAALETFVLRMFDVTFPQTVEMFSNPSRRTSLTRQSSVPTQHATTADSTSSLRAMASSSSLTSSGGGGNDSSMSSMSLVTGPPGQDPKRNTSTQPSSTVSFSKVSMIGLFMVKWRQFSRANMPLLIVSVNEYTVRQEIARLAEQHHVELDYSCQESFAADVFDKAFEAVSQQPQWVVLSYTQLTSEKLLRIQSILQLNGVHADFRVWILVSPWRVHRLPFGLVSMGVKFVLANSLGFKKNLYQAFARILQQTSSTSSLSSSMASSASSANLESDGLLSRHDRLLKCVGFLHAVLCCPDLLGYVQWKRRDSFVWVEFDQSHLDALLESMLLWPLDISFFEAISCLHHAVLNVYSSQLRDPQDRLVVETCFELFFIGRTVSAGAGGGAASAGGNAIASPNPGSNERGMAEVARVLHHDPSSGILLDETTLLMGVMDAFYHLQRVEWPRILEEIQSLWELESFGSKVPTRSILHDVYQIKAQRHLDLVTQLAQVLVGSEFYMSEPSLDVGGASLARNISANAGVSVNQTVPSGGANGFGASIRNNEVMYEEILKEMNKLLLFAKDLQAYPRFEANLLSERLPLAYTSPLNFILHEEIHTMELTRRELVDDIARLDDALHGLMHLTNAERLLWKSILAGQIPGKWRRKFLFYEPKSNSLAEFQATILSRLHYLASWVTFSRPMRLAIDKFRNPDGILEALHQHYARCQGGIAMCPPDCLRVVRIYEDHPMLKLPLKDEQMYVNGLRLVGELRSDVTPMSIGDTKKTNPTKVLATKSSVGGSIPVVLEVTSCCLSPEFHPDSSRTNGGGAGPGGASQLLVHHNEVMVPVYWRSSDRNYEYKSKLCTFSQYNSSQALLAGMAFLIQPFDELPAGSFSTSVSPSRPPIDTNK